MSRPVTIPQTVPDVVFFRNWWVETWFQILLDEVEQEHKQLIQQVQDLTGQRRRVTPPPIKKNATASKEQ